MTSLVEQVTPIHSSTIANGTPKYIYAVDDAMPADIADPVNFIWNHGYFPECLGWLPEASRAGTYWGGW